MVVLDTSITIDFLYGDKEAYSSLDNFSSEDIFLTPFTIFELLKNKNRENMEGFIDSINTLIFDSKSAKISSKIYKDLKNKGIMINIVDIFIASICISHNDRLITKDKDFSRIDGLKYTLI